MDYKVLTPSGAALRARGCISHMAHDWRAVYHKGGEYVHALTMLGSNSRYVL